VKDPLPHHSLYFPTLLPAPAVPVPSQAQHTRCLLVSPEPNRFFPPSLTGATLHNRLEGMQDRSPVEMGLPSLVCDYSPRAIAVSRPDRSLNVIAHSFSRRRT
jgi:hypothetical protein